MESLWKLIPLLLVFDALIVCMLLIDRKFLNIKSKTVGDGQRGSASFATPKKIDAAFQGVRYEPQVRRRKPPCDLPQGIIIGCNMMRLGREEAITAIVERGDVHALMIGAAGVDKTAKFLYPNLEYCCASSASLVATGARGGFLRSYAPIAKKYYGYDTSVLDLRNPTQNDGFSMLRMVNHYMDEYLQTGSLVAKVKAERYIKIVSKTVINSGGFDSADTGQNAFFYDSAEGLIIAVISVIAEFCSPYALTLKQARQRQKALEQQKREIAQVGKACIDKDIDFLSKAQTAILQKNAGAEILFQPEEQKEERGEERCIVSVFKLIQDLLGPSEVKGKNQFKLLMERLPEEHKTRWLSGTALNTSDQAAASMLSTALSRLNAFLDFEVEQLLYFGTKINTEKFYRNKSAVFLIMPEKDDNRYFLISLIVQQLYREMLFTTDEMGGKLPNRVMFFLDGFGTLPTVQSAEMIFSASRSRRISFVPIIQSLAQLEKSYGKEGADIIIDNCQICIYDGFAPNSEAADVLSKMLGGRTVMAGSISQGRDKSKSLQMAGRPLMTPDELEIMSKDTFIVIRTGVEPMKTKLKLFFEWGIELNETYPIRQAVVRKIHYANKKTIEEAITRKYGLPQNPLRQPVKYPIQEQDKSLYNISKAMKGVEKSYG